MKKINYSKKVDDYIKSVLSSPYPVLNSCYKNSSFSRGKKLRSGLFLSFANRFDQEAIKIASCIELIHLASLIHDDVLDDAVLRRGKKPLYKKNGNKESILYGDYLFSKSFSMLTEIKEKAVFKEMNKALSEIIEGEIMQQSREGDISVSEEEYCQIIGKKTARLIASSCKVGAMVNKNTKISSRSAFNFGYNLGMAYQIYDDCNDYFGINENKKKLIDIKNKVITLPIINLFRASSNKEKQKLKKFFHNSRLSAEQTKRIISEISRKGAFNESILEAEKYIKKGKNIYKKNFKNNNLGHIINRLEEKLYELKEYCDNRRRIRRA